MKKVKFFNLIVCLLIFAGMAGCSDDTPPPSNRDDFDLKKINYRSHFTNPYDTIGKYHNEALASVFKEYLKLPRAKSSAEEKERLNKLIVSFVNNNPFQEGMNITEENLQQFELQVKAKSSDRQMFYSDKQIEYYNRLKDIVSKDKHASPQDFISSINKLEKQIAESDLPEQEINQLLMGMSVAKYSSVFWMQQVKNMNQPAKTGTTTYIEGEFYDGDWDKWFADFRKHAESVLWADVEGGIQGFALAFILSDHIGPLLPAMGVAVITTVIKGAVIGAIGNSIWNGIKILFNISFE